MLKVIVTGSDGRFGKILQKLNNNFIFKNKKQLNILFPGSIRKNLNKYKPTHILHLAGLSRPMKIHDQNIRKSIDLNIIGTSNITKVCSELKIKLIFISTSYVYPGEKGNYRESDPIKPINNYGLSKMGGEAAVQMYKNSLIIRASMTEKPFIHKNAFFDFISNFAYHEDIAKIILKTIDQKGIINIGGKSQSVYNFAKSKNAKVKKISIKKILGKNSKSDVSMNLNKIKKFLRSC